MMNLPGGMRGDWFCEAVGRGGCACRTVFKRPTQEPSGQSRGALVGTARAAARERRGTGWQTGQKYDDRFMNATLRMGAPHRSHGSPSRP